MKHIPNLLSIIRLCLSFFIIPLLINNNWKPVFLIFIICSVSDFLDGYVARKFHFSSELGAMLDPLADKILIVISYTTLFCIKIVPFFVWIAVMMRDVLIVSFVLTAKIRSIKLVFAPLISSKINTAIQMLYVINIIACKCFEMHIPFLLDIFAVIVTVSTIFSGVEYAYKYRKIASKCFR